ncbi:DHH family phosphoesterase [Sulfurimonas sp.]|nr:DHH family phosphoesterase [Sulfurimonas sp.]
MNTLIEKIDSAKHVVVISHVNPDADSIGSSSAMYTYLLQKHKKASWYCKTKDLSNNFSFIPWFDKIKDSFPVSADLAISLDCGDAKRLGLELECDLINIDHHASNKNYGTINLVDSNAISTSVVLYDFFKANDVKINAKMATAIYAGLLDDSNALMSDDVDGTIFAIVRDLIDSGAEHKVCSKYIVKSMSLAALRLKGKMFTDMSLEYDAQVSVFCVSKDDMKSTGARGEDCEEALEESVYLPHVEVALLLKENSNGSIKGSLRSNGKVDAAKIASQLNGGGHKSRAGFSIDAGVSLSDAKEKLLSLIKKEI